MVLLRPSQYKVQTFYRVDWFTLNKVHLVLNNGWTMFLSQALGTLLIVRCHTLWSRVRWTWMQYSRIVLQFHQSNFIRDGTVVYNFLSEISTLPSACAVVTHEPWNRDNIHILQVFHVYPYKSFRMVMWMLCEDPIYKGESETKYIWQCG